MRRIIIWTCVALLIAYLSLSSDKLGWNCDIDMADSFSLLKCSNSTPSL